MGLYGIQNTGSIHHHASQNKSGSTDYRDQMLPAAMLLLYDSLHRLLENLLTGDLGLSYYYNLSDDRHNNLSVFLYNHSDDIVNKELSDGHLSIGNLYSDDQKSPGSKQQSYDTFHNLLDMTELCDLLLNYSLIDDKIYSQWSNLMSFLYGSLNIVMVDAHLAK